MKVLVVGGGGREHTLVWALHRSPSVEALYAAPGNPGIGQLATCVPLEATDIEGLAKFAQDRSIDLTVVGPEAPLGEGLVDRFAALGLRAFGPTQAAAEIETSKAFSKRLMEEEGIPTARYRTFDDPGAAKTYVRQQGVPIVIKPDGLASGRGVVVCHDLDQAYTAIDRIMVEGIHGAAGRRIVIEECLTGQEATVLALTDGETICPLVPSQDHKPIYDGDTGPNTGGMGAYAPAPIMDETRMQTVMDRILQPAVRGMADRGRPYRGVLYAGLMVTQDGIKTIEFNCRFGDPEAQAVLPLLKTDLGAAINAVCDGALERLSLEWHKKAAACVVLASRGYPGKFETGKPISGLDALGGMEDVIPFHAGTAVKDGRFVTNGGRVLGITAMADDLPSAIARAYEAVDRVDFEGKYCRRDIGQKALKHG